VLVKLKVGDFLLALREAGINLMPSDLEAGRVAALVLKKKELENKVYADMASIVSSFDLGWSRWNMKVVQTLLIIFFTILICLSTLFSRYTGWS
jgi:hypothetical protein